MNNHTYYAKKFGIKELIIERSQLSNSNCYDASSGKINSSFGFIKKGSVILNSMGNQIHNPTGSLFNLPDGVRYNSVWSGGPDIEYYSIHMVSNKYDLLSRENNSIQHIPEFSFIIPRLSLRFLFCSCQVLPVTFPWSCPELNSKP